MQLGTLRTGSPNTTKPQKKDTKTAPFPVNMPTMRTTVRVRLGLVDGCGAWSLSPLESTPAGVPVCCGH